jgi:excisionase family DNA binding protein
VLSVSEAAKRLPAITEPTLRGMVKRREIDAVRIGRRVLIPEDELRRVFGALYGAGVAQ